MFSYVSVILFTGGSWSLSWGEGDLCPGGSLSGGVSVWGGLCPGRVSVWGSMSWRPPPYGNERAVRILLECILVFLCFLVFSVTSGNPV